MPIKILCPQWGHEHLPLADFLEKVKAAGYDGVDLWMPEDESEKEALPQLLQDLELDLVAHQHQAQGDSFEGFMNSFEHHLTEAASLDPLLINSHTGRDYFTFEENCELVDCALQMSELLGVTIAHETHRGRFLYSPGIAQEYFHLFPEIRITADLSHWVCVSESYLEGYEDTLKEAIKRTVHVHARVGYTQSAQVPDPRVKEWEHALGQFLGWWDAMVEHHQKNGNATLAFTTEFGPPPYMVTHPETGQPIASQWEINCFMKDLLRERYG